MLNASVGVQRAVGRLRRPPITRASAPTTAISLVAALQLPRRIRSLGASLHLTARHHALRPGWSATMAVPIAAQSTRQARGSLFSRIGHDRAVALVAAGILLGASIVSVSTSRPAPAVGGTTGPGPDVRLAAGGGGLEFDGGTVVEAEPQAALDFNHYGEVQELRSSDLTIDVPAAGTVDPLAAASEDPIDDALAAEIAQAAEVEGPFLDDGTLLKPVAVNTTVADGSELMQTYKVKAGDTLVGIAKQFGVSMMTLWWANKLESKDDLHLGQVLTIPPVTGLVVTVQASDTLASIAARYDVEEQEILDANKLTDPNLVVGQVLAIPGAMGEAIPIPKTPERSSSGGGGGGGGGGGSSRAPVTYTGGAFRWPVSGGGNYISQYFRYGHYGLDIAADYGSPVRAAAGGTVIFAGWKGNGGGYQVWIAHGSGLYSTYNHMSAISVGSGQRVSEGQSVGRIGSSGRATGPHLHFEVWRGSIWNGGTRVNPLAYL